MKLPPYAAFIFCVGLCSCTVSPDDAVRDEPTAIAIGKTVCAKTFPRNADGTEADPIPDRLWHAQLSLSGLHWEVWAGAKLNGHAALEVDIDKRDGSVGPCQAPWQVS
jgi:hypothetical protein